MLRLYRFNLLRIIRGREEMFWSLLFPIVLGTLFYVTFGSSTSEMMQPVDAAVVKEGNAIFETFLTSLDGEMLTLSEMEEGEAQQAHENGEIKGIFYSSTEPELVVAGTQIEESILEMLLDGYVQNQHMMETIAKDHPLGLLKAAGAVSETSELVGQISVGGRTLDGNLDYFFALIAMACLFGCFMGMSSATALRADQSPLAARRSIVPVHRFSMVVSELLAVFTVQFLNICVLLAYLHFVLQISFGDRWLTILPICVLGSMTGVAYGIFIGSLNWREGTKNGIAVSTSLLMSFLAGLMFGNMKHVVEQFCPILNRLNPAALISDAFYSITVYESMDRYWMNLFLLGVFTAVLVVISFLKLGRERYDSL